LILPRQSKDVPGLAPSSKSEFVLESYSRHISSGLAGQFARKWPFNADTRCPEAADRCEMDSCVKVLVLGGRSFGVISCNGRGNLSTRRSELQALRRPQTKVYHLVCARLPYKKPVSLSTHIHTDDTVKRPSSMRKSIMLFILGRRRAEQSLNPWHSPSRVSGGCQVPYAFFTS
jgi:hypothetical protein